MADPKREGSDTRGREPLLARLWPAALFLLIAATIGVTAVSVLALREASSAQQRLLDDEVTALLLTHRAHGLSQTRTRLAHEALLSGSEEFAAAATAAGDELDRLIPKLRGRLRGEDEAEVLGRVEGLQARAFEQWRDLLAARQRGEPVGVLVERWQADIHPLRVRLDQDYAALARFHEDRLAAGRADTGTVARTATRALLVAAAVALALAVTMAAVARGSLTALSRSEARYRATFERAAVGIAHVGLDGRWLRANQRFQEILGYSEAELRLLYVKDVTHAEHLAEEHALAERLVRGEVEVYGIEKRYVRKDGRTTWVQLTVALVRDGAGRPRYLIAAAEPIDLRKATEEELRDAVRARDEFLNIASHELRTPLTSLKLQLESLRGSLSRPDALSPERLQSKADSALRQSARLGTLVDELLDVARLAEGGVTVESEEGDLVATVRAVVERMRPDAARSGSELRVVAPEGLHARFDPARLEQALTHLVANALKYGAGKPVDVLVQRQGPSARVLVRDRGIGVDPAERERIFGRFERAVSSRHYGGLGLGLFVARRIVEAHGGTISLDSEPGEGSTFAIELPLEGPPAEVAASA